MVRHRSKRVKRGMDGPTHDGATTDVGSSGVDVARELTAEAASVAMTAAQAGASGLVAKLGELWDCPPSWLECRWKTIGALSLVALVVYSNSLFGELVYDDASCLGHGAVTGKASLLSLFATDFWGKDLAHVESHRSWRPLTTFVFRQLFSFADGTTAVFHAASILVYMAVVALVYTLFEKLLADKRVSFLAALLFCVHPVHVEVVANITNLAECLSGLFFLLSVVLYAGVLSSASTNIRSMRVWAPIVLGAMAMFAKETGITSLGVLLVMDVVAHLSFLRAAFTAYVLGDVAPEPAAPAKLADNASAEEVEAHTAACLAWKAGAKQRGWVAYKARMLRYFCHRAGAILSVIVAALLLRMVFLRGSPPSFPRHMNHVASEPSLWVRLLTFLYLPVAHVWMLVFPQTLCHDWSFDSVPLVRSPFDVRFLATVLMYYCLARLVVHAASALWSAAASHRGRFLFAGRMLSKLSASQSDAAVLALGLALTIIPYIPASNMFFYVGFVLADRVLFLPSIGFCLVLGVAIKRAMRGKGKHDEVARRNRGFLLLAMLVASLLLAGRSIVRTGDWRSEHTLTEAAVRANPGNAKVWYNRGVVALENGRDGEGVAHHKTAIMLWKDYVDPLMALSTYYSTASPPDYDAAFRYAAQVADTDIPVGDLGKMTLYGAAYTRLAEVTERRGLPAEALFQKAFEIFSRDPDVLRTIGLAYSENNTPVRAIQYLTAFFNYTPDIDTADTLAKLYVSQLNYTEAEKWALKSAQLGSSNGYYNLGRIRQLMFERVRDRGHAVDGERAVDPDEIEQAFRASLANFPSNSNPHKWLGKFLQRQARTPNVTGAAHHYRLALQRDAMDYVCNNNLGAILLDSRTHLGEAERAFRRALQVEPNSVASMSNLGRVLHFRGRSQEAADYLYASLERINATPDWPQTPTSSPALLHRALAMIWAHVPNRERVAMHCQQGGCDTDAVLAEFSGVAS